MEWLCNLYISRLVQCLSKMSIQSDKTLENVCEGGETVNSLMRMVMDHQLSHLMWIIYGIWYSVTFWYHFTIKIIFIQSFMKLVVVKKKKKLASIFISQLTVKLILFKSFVFLITLFWNNYSSPATCVEFVLCHSVENVLTSNNGGCHLPQAWYLSGISSQPKSFF